MAFRMVVTALKTRQGKGTASVGGWGRLMYMNLNRVIREDLVIIFEQIP